MTIKVKKIRFTQPAFRKLGELTIEFSDRITLIAGHNGIGKSTIMALVANSSGLSSSQQHKNLFGKAYQGNLFEIIHIDYVQEYLKPKNSGSLLPEPIVEYLINGADLLEKASSITGRSDTSKARIVPRNTPHKRFISSDGLLVIGPDAKVPLPTIYLGMTRMFPVGEANPNWVNPVNDKSIDPLDASFISTFVNSVVIGSKTTSTSITSIGIKGTGKLAKHPHYGFDARCVSLGQDSLGSIATALASFQKLKRSWVDYPGGLLVIDEIDAGLHPHAQRKLIKSIQKSARDLNLQVIATTHSAHVLEALHPDGSGNEKSPDSVVYLMDTAKPRLAADFSLQHVLDDMNLKAPIPKQNRTLPEVKIYFEDDEAAQLFAVVFPLAARRKMSKRHRVKLLPLPLGIGCDNLIGLSRHDKYFEKVVIAVDADTSIRGKPEQTAHIVKIPGAKDSAGAGLSPERTIFHYIQELLAKPEEHEIAWNALHKDRLTSDQLREHLLDGDWNIANRESAKKWWKSKFNIIDSWKLLQLWSLENQPVVEEFISRLDGVVEIVAARQVIP